MEEDLELPRHSSGPGGHRLRLPGWGGQRSQGAPAGRWRWLLRPTVQVGLLLAAGLGLYLHTLHAPFILDDLSCIKENPAIRNFEYFLDFDKVRQLAIWEDIKNSFALRPVAYLTFALNYRFGGLDVFGYHLVNIAIHLVNAVLVWLLARVTLSRAQLSWSAPHLPGLIPLLTALLFVVHPLQTQAVTYVNQRFTSLLTMLYLSALLLYVAARTAARPSIRRCSFGLALLATVLAMKTQETAFTLPAMLCLFELLFLEGPPRQRWFTLAPFLLTMLIIPGTLWWLTTANGSVDPRDQIVQSVNLVNFSGISQSDYLVTQFGAIVTYLRLFLLPVGQSLIPYYPVAAGFFEAKTLLSLALLLLLFGGALRGALRAVRSRQRSVGLLIAFGILWFFVSIAVSSSVIPLETMFLEYRVYLPSIGLFFAGVVAAMAAVDRGWLPLRAVLSGMVLFVALLSAATFTRNTVYTDKIRILQDTLAKNPEALPARLDLVNELLGQERYDEAIPEITRILGILPNDPNMITNLGYAFEATGQVNEAVRQYLRALEINPGNPFAHSNLGLLYQRMGLLPQAEAEFQAALRTDPHFGAARQSLAILYEEQGRTDAALQQYRMLLDSYPDNRYVAAKIRMLAGN